ncbi:2' O-ribose methyltransferase [Candidozyma auris]
MMLLMSLRQTFFVPLLCRAKSGTSSRRWVLRQMVDPHSKQSKTEGYRSRAAYKLLEIDTKFKIFGKKTKNIVDLGFAPGAWTQVALNKSKARGVEPNILGVDLINCSPPEGSSFIQGDIFSKKTHEEISAHFQGPIQLVLSDMMANTSGIGDNDHYASMELCDGVLLLALKMLQKNGSLVMKFYTGKEDQLLQKRLEKVFHKVHKMKPAACRAESREMYFVCLKKRKDNVAIEEVFDGEEGRV